MGALAKRLSSEVVDKVKVLTIDIENRPAVAHVWGMFKQNVSLSQLVEPSSVMGVGYKFYDDKTATFISDHSHGHNAMIRETHAILSSADIVVSYNGIGFDLPHLNREFLLLGLTPPKPYKQVDLLRVARKQFRFQSNKLDHVASQLGLGNKVHHEGHDLWTKCMAGDPEAWERMAQYCRQDVELTESLFDRLRPWVPNMPHLSMWMGTEWGCPACGHEDLSNHNEGTAYAYVQRYRLYHCPSCGTWVRGNKRLQDPTQTRQARING